MQTILLACAYVRYSIFHFVLVPIDSDAHRNVYGQTGDPNDIVNEVELWWEQVVQSGVTSNADVISYMGPSRHACKNIMWNETENVDPEVNQPTPEFITEC